MRYETGVFDLSRITLGETDTARSVLQNVRLILRTPKFTVPLYRQFGMDVGIVDKPVTAAHPILYAEVKETVEKFEPRCRVTAVDFVIEKESPGVLSPRVEVEING